MRKYIYTVCCVLGCLTAALAQNLTKAQQAYEKGDFTAAKEEYAQVIATATGENLWLAQLRTAACEYSLGEVLNAAKTLLNYPLPHDTLWQARFLIYRTFLAQQASSTYRRILNEHEVLSSQAQQDPAQWTPKQWQAHIDQDYRHLWNLRATLVNAPIEQEKLILNLADTDTKRIPTLFDFTVQNWKEYLQNNPALSVEALAPQTPHFLEGTARLKEGPRKDTALLVMQLLESAAVLGGKSRQNAQIFWKTDFIVAPFSSDAFVVENKDTALQHATAQLQLLAGQTTPATSSWWNRLKTYVTPSSQTDYARSYAAHQLAQLLYNNKQYKPALETCQYAQTLTPSYFTQTCQQLINDITRVELHTQSTAVPVNRQTPTLSFRAKNLTHVYARIYPTSFEELTQLYKSNNRRGTINSWQMVTHLDSQHISNFLKNTPLHLLSKEIPAREVGQTQEVQLALPALETGFYVVLLCAQKNFDPQQADIYGWVINATDLALFATAAIAADPAEYVASKEMTPRTLKPEVFHLYTVNLKTGQPVPHADLKLITDWNGSTETAHTDKTGQLDLRRTVQISPKENANNTSYTLDVLATHGPSTAYTPGRLYFHFYNEAPVKLFAQTDRPIYRPGQKVQLAAQAFERLPRGLQTLGNTPLTFQITDPNGKRIFQARSTLNALGSAQSHFVLPEEALLGTYSILVSLTTHGRTYRTYHSFKMEEYKRPDYEITLSDPQKPLEYGKKAVLTGSAHYYTGVALEKATVNYTLKRRGYVPPFYWWWARPLPAEEKIILQGHTTTDEKGAFKISFTPTQLEEDEEFANYILQAEVLDESGRAISTTHSYKISAHPHLFRVNFTQGFYDANKPATLAEVDLTDPQGNSTSGKVTLKIVRLENKRPDTQTPQARCYDCPESSSRLDALYKDFTPQQTLLTKTLSFDKTGSQTVSLPAVAEGVYRMELTGEKAATQRMVFVVANEKSHLLLPDLALAQHATYHPGETLRVLLGTTAAQATQYVEVYQEGKFLTNRAQLPGGVQVFTLPVTSAHRGGLALRWFSASDYTFHQAQTSIQVPFDHKKLQVDLSKLPASLKPAEKVNWQIAVKDSAGKPVTGLLNATVYDKSLDYYAKNSPALTFAQLYTQNTNAADVQNSRQGPTQTAWYKPQEKKANTDLLPLLALPTINLQMPWRAYGRGIKRTFGATTDVMMLSSNAVAAKMAAPKAASMRSAAVQEEAAFAKDDSLEADEGAAADEPSSAEIRTDFSETAYFNPALPITNGKATMQFTLPQSLTTWNILGFALTAKASLGNFEASLISRKDLMLRLQLPRFYREADHGVIQAAITNQTSRKITTQVTLSITNEGHNALRDFGVSSPTQTVTVAANSTHFVSWTITAPNKPDLYQITAVARSATHTDAEQKTLPVLPSKMRLLASAHTALKNGTNTLQLTELNHVNPADVELTALALHPSLALTVLNSMPQLLSSPYKDLVSSLNRYVPLAVVNQFYTTYPQLKQAVAKLPKRTGLTPSWNEKDPLRLQLLEQTPWLRQAQGRQVHQADIINLFDAKVVASSLEKELKNIARFQNANGAFTWFAGGPDDDYLTLYALHSFSEALTYQAAIPQQAAQQALGYIVPRIENRLKQDKNGSVGSVSYALYAAYTLSNFPAHWKESAQAKPAIKRWVDYADKQAKFMTPLGQIYAAAVYHRLGDDIKANRYLDLVLSRMKEDPLTGAYFTPEAQSWLWYNDTLSTQAITLRTLLAIRPNSDKVDALTQWLLFNRQTNDWTNTKATAQAVFTLLDVMQAKGALTQASSYQITWGGQKQQLHFEPLDWTEDLQWVRTKDAASPQTYTATLEKEGPLLDFASLNAIYRAGQVDASAKGVINVHRHYFKRLQQGTEIKLLPLSAMEAIQVGDEIEVHLTLSTDSAFEYVFLQDPKPAGFEAEELLSGWAYQNISFYREVKDASTHFFINWLPHGSVTLRYLLRPTVPGRLHALPAQVQSMYAPQFGAHSASNSFEVEK